MLVQAVKNIMAAIQGKSISQKDWRRLVNSCHEAIAVASRDEREQALSELAPFVVQNDPAQAGDIALICGVLVEQGGAPEILATVLMPRLEALLRAAAVLAEACEIRMKLKADENEDNNNDDEEEEDPLDIFDEIRTSLVPAMPAENAAWEELQYFWCPGIAVFSKSPSLRRAAGHWREMTGVLAEYHDAGYWLDRILPVLDNEPILVIEPDTKRGILAHLSGVSDNFQLNVLLMDRFPAGDFQAGPRVSPGVAAVASGNGPQRGDETVTGVWNLYTYQAIRADLTLPGVDEYAAHWIWNEGRPEDIPVFEGYRVILLGPASYSRFWQSQRDFSVLSARLDIERDLTKDEVEEWLRKMVKK